MFEKVSPAHPDKLCDRLAGAIVDLAYSKEENPRIAVEVLAGHGKVFVIIETSLSREQMSCAEIDPIIWRIFGQNVEGNVTIVPQDPHLADNQRDKFRCGDNGIFKGVPKTLEQNILTQIAAEIYQQQPTDGKYLIGDVPEGHCKPAFNAKMTIPARNGYRIATPKHITICQSHAKSKDIYRMLADFEKKYTSDTEIKSTVLINPLGEWTGGLDTDSGATNRKLGSDMGDGVTGGGLHGKDLSKADVSVNIVCHILAQRTGKPVTAMCSIGDEQVTFCIGDEVRAFGYDGIVNKAQCYIKRCGGFEKFSEWGLIRPIG